MGKSRKVDPLEDFLEQIIPYSWLMHSEACEVLRGCYNTWENLAKADPEAVRDMLLCTFSATPAYPELTLGMTNGLIAFAKERVKQRQERDSS